MPSGWDVYYIVFLSAFLSLGIPAALALISRLIRAKQPRRSADVSTVPTAPNSQSILGQKINTRFFLAANSALILITLMLVLVPCVGIIQSTAQEGASHGDSAMALVSVVSIAGFAALGLLYSARKGDLGWLKSFQTGKKGK